MCVWVVVGGGQMRGQMRPHRLLPLPPAGAPEVIVAVLDTGFDLTHPDLRANLWVNPGETPGNGRDDDGNGEARGGGARLVALFGDPRAWPGG